MVAALADILVTADHIRAVFVVVAARKKRPITSHARVVMAARFLVHAVDRLAMLPAPSVAVAGS